MKLGSFFILAILIVFGFVSWLVAMAGAVRNLCDMPACAPRSRCVPLPSHNGSYNAGQGYSARCAVA